MPKWITDNIASLGVIFGAIFTVTGVIIAALINGKYSTLNKIIDDATKREELSDKREESATKRMDEFSSKQDAFREQVFALKSENAELIRLNNFNAAQIEELKHKHETDIATLKHEHQAELTTMSRRYDELHIEHKKLQKAHQELQMAHDVLIKRMHGLGDTSYDPMIGEIGK